MNRIHHQDSQSIVQSLINQSEKQIIRSNIPQQNLNKNMKNQLILNKLCYDNKIYFTEKSDLTKSFKNAGQIFHHDEKIKEEKKKREENETKEENEIKEQQNKKQEENKQEEKNKWLDKIQKFICNRRSNIFTRFFFTFICLLLINVFIVPWFLFTLTFLYITIKNKYGKKFIVLFSFSLLQTLFSTCFYYLYHAFGALDDADHNIRFYGINSLTLVGLLYTVASQAGILIFILNYEHQKKNYEIKTALDDLEVPSDQLYFETIDRNKIDNFINQRKKKTNIYQFVERSEQDISENLKLISSEKNTNLPHRHLKKKVWNSGYYLLSHDQPREEKLFVLSKNYLWFCYGLGISCILLHIILPIVFLATQAEDDFDRWNIVLIIFCNIYYSFFFVSNCFISYLTYEPFSTVEMFTSLLEIKGQMSKYEFKKNVPTINLYCITSINTWFYIRQLMLNTNQFVFRFSNLLQSIDVVCFLSLSSIIFMDFLGIGWRQNSIFQNKLVFTLMLSNILIRLILLIIPIFFNFSYVNDLLLYNKEQIESIKTRLIAIHRQYRALRNSWQKQIDKLELDKFADITQPQDLKEELLNRSSNRLNGIMDCYKIEQMRVVYEIQRNAELFSSVDLLESTNQSSNYQELTDEKRIHREIEYFSALINTYQSNYEDMNTKQEKHLLKFLGIIPISYNNALGLLLFALPALFSIILERISQ